MNPDLSGKNYVGMNNRSAVVMVIELRSLISAFRESRNGATFLVMPL